MNAPSFLLPTRWQAVLFAAKTTVFQARRAWREIIGGRPPRLLHCPADEATDVCLAENRSALYASDLPAEAVLQAGKVQNLRVAVACLDGLMIRRGELFSFWAQVPRPTRRRGFAPGRELREGCLVPSIGGGLCQLSNALYDAALTAGCEIVERHAHSRRVPGSVAEATGRDATVFWNYVDLRFRPPVDTRLEVRLTGHELVVCLRALSAADARVPTGKSAPPSPLDYHVSGKPVVESCETCAETGCFRHPGPLAAAMPTDGVTAWLVDAWWPEFDRYLRQHRRAEDWLFLPLDGASWRVENYRWETRGFARRRQALRETLRRSWTSRRLAAQGAERQRALLRFDEALARRYARGLPVDARHLVVSQTLLPYLWRTGALGGRSFDVLMTRMPLGELQATLDRAAARHPQSRTLADFRVSPEWIADEAAALAAARRWITPHSRIARLAGEQRAVKLPWEIPSPSPFAKQVGGGGRDVLFPASTLGRKGAYELADAARELGLRVRLGGALLEGAEPWRGVETAPFNGGWGGIGSVVLPAWVEHQPRRLLQAAADGWPVVAGEGCGLAGVPGIVTVPEGDVGALREHLSGLLNLEPRPMNTA